MLRRLRHRSTYTDERGFTMIAAVVVLFIGSLLLTATYLSANGDIKLTRTSLNSKKAYYAALAGIANFEYHLNNNSEYEKTCPVVKEATVPQSTTESKTEPTIETYSYQVVAASESAYSVCTKNVSLSMIESNKRATGTFRVISTGTAGTKNKPGYQTRSVVATFTHAGFTHWVYYTNYEDLDPNFYKPTVNCARHEFETIEGKTSERSSKCLQIEFVTGDSLKGPVHTNDAADICGEPIFGREGDEDKIEINGGTYSSCGSDKPNFKGEYTTKGAEITPPATDAELANAASSEYHFEGKTLITLNANLSKPEEANTITVENANLDAGAPTTLPWPVSGVLYVSNSSSGCGYTEYSPYDSIYTTDQGCGNAYVHGTYTHSLTIGTENDIVINGDIQTQTNSEGKPEGNGVLGLIATNYIRIYHPVAEGSETTHSTPKTESPTLAYKEEAPRLQEKNGRNCPSNQRSRDDEQGRNADVLLGQRTLQKWIYARQQKMHRGNLPDRLYARRQSMRSGNLPQRLYPLQQKMHQESHRRSLQNGVHPDHQKMRGQRWRRIVPQQI